MLGLKVTSKAISTSSPVSLNSLPSTSFIGTSDEFFNFRAMPVSQAQHKLDKIGEINLINSLWSSRTHWKKWVPSKVCKKYGIYLENVRYSCGKLVFQKKYHKPNLF